MHVEALDLVAVADLHGHLPRTLPSGDVLAVVGDVFPSDAHRLDRQLDWLTSAFVPWLARQRFERILLVAGNHDFLFATPRRVWLDRLPPNVCYLQDETATIRGLRIHGSPWVPVFGGWPFELPEIELAEKWQRIPADADVLLVHGPPFGFCDLTAADRRHAGSQTLNRRIKEIEPQLVVCGHIHEAYGQAWLGEKTLVANVSLLDERYRPAHHAQRFQLPLTPNEPGAAAERAHGR